MKRYRHKLIVLIILCTLLLLTACSKKNDDKSDSNTQVINKQYTMVNNLTYSEVKQIVTEAIIGIYMPANQENIDKSILKLKDIATEEELNQLKADVGAYDASRSASLKNIKVDIATPINTENHCYKIAATFDVTLGTLTQSTLLVFRCNLDGYISAHSIRVYNN